VAEVFRGLLDRLGIVFGAAAPQGEERKG
jgi:hypothetical protein